MEKFFAETMSHTSLAHTDAFYAQVNLDNVEVPTLMLDRALDLLAAVEADIQNLVQIQSRKISMVTAMHCSTAAVLMMTVFIANEVAALNSRMLLLLSGMEGSLFVAHIIAAKNISLKERAGLEQEMQFLTSIKQKIVCANMEQQSLLLLAMCLHTLGRRLETETNKLTDNALVISRLTATYSSILKDIFERDLSDDISLTLCLPAVRLMIEELASMQDLRMEWRFEMMKRLCIMERLGKLARYAALENL